MLPHLLRLLIHSLQPREENNALPPFLGLFTLALVGCASTQPYWEDQKWAAEMYQAVQAALKYPPEADPKAESANGSVQFTYAGRRIHDVEIVKSTNSDIVDAAILRELDNLPLPVVPGLQANEPHRFQVDVHVPTPLDEYLLSMKMAILKSVRYPMDADMNSAYRAVDVGYDYRDGQIQNVVVAKTSGSKAFDNAAVDTFSRVKMPPIPEAFKEMHYFVVQICFSLGREFCPTSRTVIRVINDSDVGSGKNH